MACLSAWRRAQKAQEAEYGDDAPRVAQDARRARIEEERRNRTAAREGGASEAASAGHRTEATRDAGSAPAVAATALLADGSAGDFTKVYGGGDWQSFASGAKSAPGPSGGGFDYSNMSRGFIPPHVGGKDHLDAVEQAPYSASDCSNMTCLNAWKRAQKAQEAKYGGDYAPQVAQDAWRANVEREYNASRARIAEATRDAGSAPAVAATALLADGSAGDFTKVY